MTHVYEITHNERIHFYNQEGLFEGDLQMRILPRAIENCLGGPAQEKYSPFGMCSHSVWFVNEISSTPIVLDSKSKLFTLPVIRIWTQKILIIIKLQKYKHILYINYIFIISYMFCMFMHVRQNVLELCVLENIY